MDNYRAAAPPPASAQTHKNNTFDKKMFEPEKLENLASFKDWTEDFADYVDMCDGDLREMLKVARDALTACARMGDSEETVKRSCAVCRVLKRCVTQEDAKAIGTHAPDKNACEARVSFS